MVEAIDLLCDTPAAGSALKGEFEGLRRLRVGHYRVVYEWQLRELVILLMPPNPLSPTPIDVHLCQAPACLRWATTCWSTSTT